MYFRVSFPDVAKKPTSPHGYEAQIAGPVGDGHFTGSLFRFPGPDSDCSSRVSRP